MWVGMQEERRGKTKWLQGEWALTKQVGRVQLGTEKS